MPRLPGAISYSPWLSESSLKSRGQFRGLPGGGEARARRDPDPCTGRLIRAYSLEWLVDRCPSCRSRSAGAGVGSSRGADASYWHRHRVTHNGCVPSPRWSRVYVTVNTVAVLACPPGVTTWILPVLAPPGTFTLIMVVESLVMVPCTP